MGIAVHIIAPPPCEAEDDDDDAAPKVDDVAIDADDEEDGVEKGMNLEGTGCCTVEYE